MEPTDGKACRRPARRDGLPRLVHRLGNLAQRTEPVRPDADRQICCSLDRLRHVGEGGLEQNSFTHWDGVLGAGWMIGIAPDVIWCISGRCQQYIGYMYCYRCSRYLILHSSWCIPMYCDVLPFTCSWRLRTSALVGFQPLQKRDFAVADRFTELDVRRPLSRMRALANQDKLSFRNFAASFGFSRLRTIEGRRHSLHTPQR